MGNYMPIFNTKVINYWDRLGRELVDFVLLDIFS